MSALSKSILWQKMEEYYSNIGNDAWADEVVPLHISSNKSLGFAYANIILAHINDWLVANKITDPNALTTPFHIIEVGAGHGKLSFYILKALTDLLAVYQYKPQIIKYVITDIAAKNITSMQAHPAFAEFIQNGMLDFACFNATKDISIKLNISQQELVANSLELPVFAVCNYLIDSLAHDAFCIENHKLYEVSLDLETVDSWQEYFSKLELKFSKQEVDVNYYQDSSLNEILKYYLNYFNEASFLIPVGGITCLQTLANFTTAPLITLVADKGVAALDLFTGVDDPDITLHGSSSMLVNFDALARYTTHKNGVALTMPNSATDFQVAVFINKGSYPVPHTKLNFLQNFSGASPQDLVNLCYYDEEVRDEFDNLDEALAILNLNHWDLNILYDLHDPIIDLITEEELTLEQYNCFKENLPKAWQYFFKLEKNVDIPFAIAMIYYQLDDYEHAVKFYNISIKEFGVNTENTYNLAITYQALDQDKLALKYAKQALDLDPEYEQAIELIAELEQHESLII